LVATNTGGTRKIYLNGNLISLANSASVATGAINSLRIAAAPGFVEIAGVLDEVRLSNVARSADWIATGYANQSQPSAFYSVGVEQTQ
jgi:MSHA biogenesis protein MshQ